MQQPPKWPRKTSVKKPSEVFKNIRFAKLQKFDKPHKSTDEEEHGAVSEIEWNQQLAHQKKRAMQEDLRKWFDPKDPEGGWKRINSKGEAIGPCAREPGEAKPKCMSNEKRAALSKKERAAAVRAKRKHDPNPERKGEPINVSNFGKGKLSESMEQLDEKNVPTNPELWARAKSMAKSKFDVYPSAYANGWASKWYKSKGGGWKSVNEEVDNKDKGEYDYEGDMVKSDLRSIMANAQRIHDMIKDDSNLPEWCQSKVTLAEDYISTVANYLTAEMNEETQINELSGETKASYTLKAKQQVQELQPHAKKGEYKDLAKNLIKKREKGIAMAKEEVEQVDEVEQIEEGQMNKMSLGQLMHKHAQVYSQAGSAKYGKRQHSAEKAIERHVKEYGSLIHKDMMDHSDYHQHFEDGNEKTELTRQQRNRYHHIRGKYNIGESVDVPFEGGKKAKGTVTDKSGAKHSPMSRVRDIARKAMERQMPKAKKPEPSNKTKVVKETMKNAKSKDKFEAEPVMTGEINR